MLSKREAPEYIAKGNWVLHNPRRSTWGGEKFLKSSLVVFYILTFLRYSERLCAMGHNFYINRFWRVGCHMKAVYFIYKCLVRLTDNDYLQ